MEALRTESEHGALGTRALNIGYGFTALRGAEPAAGLSGEHTSSVLLSKEGQVSQQ